MKLWILLVLASEATWLVALSASVLKVAGAYVGQEVQVDGLWQVFLGVFFCTVTYTTVYFSAPHREQIPAH